MKKTLLVLLLAIPSLQASDFINGHAKIDVPQGWFTLEERAINQTAAYISKEKINGPTGQFQTGVTIERATPPNMPASSFIMAVFKDIEKKGTIVEAHATNHTDTKPDSIDFLGIDKATGTATKCHYEAYDKTGVAWIVVMECPIPELKGNETLFNSLTKSLVLSPNP